MQTHDVKRFWELTIAGKASLKQMRELFEHHQEKIETAAEHRRTVVNHGSTIAELRAKLSNATMNETELRRTIKQLKERLRGLNDPASI